MEITSPEMLDIAREEAVQAFPIGEPTVVEPDGPGSYSELHDKELKEITGPTKGFGN